MSFTSNIKNEISNVEYSNSEMMSELSAILNIGVKISDEKLANSHTEILLCIIGFFFSFFF